MKIVGYQIILRITRFVTLVIRLDYQKFCLRSTPGEGTYRSTGWLSFEELDVLTAMWGVESRVDERASLCYGFQGPRTLVWEAKTNKHLERIDTYLTYYK